MQKALRKPKHRCFMADELIGKIGYTSDGLIFFIMDAQTPDGQKMSATFTYSPEQALEIAEKLTAAVHAGFDAKKGQEAKEHGRPDRTTDNIGGT